MGHLLRTFVYPFLAYRSFFVPFLQLCAVAVPCWLLIRVMYNRKSARPLSLWREVILFTGVIYFAGLATATLMPNRSARLRADGTAGVELQPTARSLTCTARNLREGSAAKSFCLHNARGNIMLFFPLGVLLPLMFRKLRVWSTLLIAIALSCSIELVQYFSRGWLHRAADVNDILLNSAGALAGVLLLSALMRISTSMSRRGV